MTNWAPPSAAQWTPPGTPSYAAPGAGQPVYASNNPDEMSEGSLVDNANLLIKAARYDNFTFPNSNPPVHTVAAIFTFTDDANKDYEQVYSAGDPREWQPSPDKRFLVAMGSKTQINSGTNYGELVRSCVNAGFPKQLLDGDIQKFVGTYGFYRRVVIQRTGLQNRNDPTQAPGQQRREAGTLLMAVLHNLPGQPSDRGTPAMAAFTPPPAGATGAAPPAVVVNGATPVAAPAPAAFVQPPPVAAPAAAPAPTPVPAAPISAPSNEAELAGQAAAWLQQYMASIPTPTIDKQTMAQAGFVAFGQHPLRNNVATMLFDDAFLVSLTQAGVAKYDPATSTLYK